jgi:hypothetical protein
MRDSKAMELVGIAKNNEEICVCTYQYREIPSIKQLKPLERSSGQRKCGTKNNTYLHQSLNRNGPHQAHLTDHVPSRRAAYVPRYLVVYDIAVCEQCACAEY